MNARLPTAFCVALGLHAGIGAWLGAALRVPEIPLIMRAQPQMEMDLTAPEEISPPLAESPPEPSPTLPLPTPAEVPPIPPEPTPPAPDLPPQPPDPTPSIPLPTPQPTPAPSPKPVSAKTPRRADKPRAVPGSDAPGNARPSVASGATSGPVCISKADPIYPAFLEERAIGGTVTVLIKIDATGRVTDASIGQSSGQAALDRAAVAGVRRWKFKPALRQGQPLASSTRVSVVFRPH